MITITRGKDKDFYINLDSKLNGRPFDLSLLVTARVQFLKDDGSKLIKSYPSGGITIASVGGGRLKVSIEVAESPTLKKTDYTTLEVDYEIGSAAAGDAANYKDTVYIEKAYRVVASKYE